MAGKKFVLDGRAFGVRGVTYGSFLPRDDGAPFPGRATVRGDFRAMRDIGVNTVRTYAVPPPDVVEAAADSGLRLLVGLHYDDWRTAGGPSETRRILAAGRREVERAVTAVSVRPEAVLGVVVGNEVPGDLVRVEGPDRVQEVLGALVAHTHSLDPELLVTYANYPTTEYLDVEGADFVAFNVFLERPGDLRRYAVHLHVRAGNRPVIISELGLAGELQGAERQAESLTAQLAEVDESGAAGACVFAWTDEWGVDGEAVGGWGFGLTAADRQPKPALDVVRRWAARDLRGRRPDWPSLSVVVCAYNEERHLDDCLASLMALDYPGVEVVVCDDGSTDATAAVAGRYPFRLIGLPHRGLSAARNAGLAATSGEIVAYLDADARCDPDWAHHLVLSLEDGVAATGGPNLPVPGAGFVERAVAASPGGPVEVLLTDDRAEHVAGCNMAFRRSALEALGGFDVAYTSAGDDVDLCWRLLDAGSEIAFAHAAQVWHHRRDTVGRYLRQQRGYGRSERMVSGRHAQRFNRLGQARWSGYLYSSPRKRWSLLRPVLYQGWFGTAPYQRVLSDRTEPVLQMGAALLPLAVPVALAGGIGAIWSPWALGLAALAVLAVVTYGALAAIAVRPAHDEPAPTRLRLLAGALHAVQPFVRTWGRLRARPLAAREGPAEEWSGDRLAWLAALQRELSRGWRTVTAGRPTDRWDLAVGVGPFVRCRITTAVVWGWTPRWRSRLVPRPAFLAAVGGAGIAGLVFPWLGAAAGALLLIGALEAGLLHRTVSRVIALTVAGAAVGRGAR